MEHRSTERVNCPIAADLELSSALDVVEHRPGRATERELALGLEFLSGAGPAANGPALTRWEQYAQVLLGSNEFLFVD